MKKLLMKILLKIKFSNNKHYFIFQKKNKNISLDNKTKEEFINNIDNINNEKSYDDEYYYINLFMIILSDYKNYPNIEYVETILNIEKFVVFAFKDFNEINLKYEFKKENIIKDSLEFFGELFVKKNKENCFLIINDIMQDLKQYIPLSDFLDNYNMNENWQLKLDVKLVERKFNIMTDLSFMFKNISTLNYESNFNNFDSINIKNMSYMFYNCSKMKKLPDISNFDTTNVSDISYMF